MTRVNITIAAGGRPMPRNPLIRPARKNAPKITNVIAMSWEGISDAVMNSFKATCFYSCFALVRFEANALYTPVPRVIAPATMRIKHIGRDK